MKINRVWAMPSKRTFQIKPIKELLHRYNYKEMIDVFPFEKQINGRKLLESLKDNSIYCILLDPPYSLHQANECYEGRFQKGISIFYNLVKKKLKVGGYAITFGWNSNGLGKKRGFEIVEILLVAHGASHNDTIVVVEKKVQGSLECSKKEKELSKNNHSPQKNEASKVISPPEDTSKKGCGSFDIWYCKKCMHKFERKVKLKSIAKCPICKTTKLSYLGQVSR